MSHGKCHFSFVPVLVLGLCPPKYTNAPRSRNWQGSRNVSLRSMESSGLRRRKWIDGGPGCMAGPLRKHLFQITDFLMRHTQLLSLNITLPFPSTTHGHSPGVCDYGMSWKIIWVVSALRILPELKKKKKKSSAGINLYWRSQCSIYSTYAK